jgi:hypothetical protein
MPEKSVQRQPSEPVWAIALKQANATNSASNSAKLLNAMRVSFSRTAFEGTPRERPNGGRLSRAWTPARCAFQFHALYVNGSRGSDPRGAKETKKDIN